METSLGQDSALDRFRAAVAQEHVVIPDTPAVLAYLRAQSGLEDLVGSVCREVRQRFGAGATLSLEVYRDPEVDDPYVVLYVRPTTYDPSVMRRIEAIRHAYSDQLAEAPGWFHITTDFRPAR
jgi:hypothetical protein